MRRQKVLSAVFLGCSFTYSQMGEVFKESPAVVIDAVVLQHEQLAHVPRCDVTGNFYRSADVIFIINFNNLCKKKKSLASRSTNRPGFWFVVEQSGPSAGISWAIQVIK